MRRRIGEGGGKGKRIERAGRAPPAILASEAKPSKGRASMARERRTGRNASVQVRRAGADDPIAICVMSANHSNSRMRIEALVRFVFDPSAPPPLTAAEAAALDAMTDEKITAAALSDPDNPPWTEEESVRGVSARRVREVCLRSGLSQPAFAEVYHINLGRLRDLEQGCTRAESAILAYFAVIDDAPDTVRKALLRAG